MPEAGSTARRLQALQALGIPQVLVRRDGMDAGQISALLPGLPGQRQASAAPAAAAGPAGPAVPPPTRTAPPAHAERAPRPQPLAQPEAQRQPAAGRPASAAAPLRRAQVETLDLKGLDAFSAACRACKLGEQRHCAVFGVGHARARLMIVGEAPGADEDRLGEPFVGAAGKLLDNMLRAIGLGRAAADAEHGVFIANVVKCRPPGNRNPEPDEIAQCEPILQRQIELVRPRLLLALGRFAAQTLTGSSEPIGRLRQRVLDYHGIPVVVSYHPAYLLRTPQDKAKSWADLCLVLDTLEVS
jgi:DNA polymerase